MKGLKLKNGDLVITNNRVEMVEDNELTRQTIESVLNTNKGEWVLSPDEGIDFHNIIGKNIPDELRENEIQQGLAQFDDAYSLTNFETTHISGRKYKAKGSIQITPDTTADINLTLG